MNAAGLYELDGFETTAATVSALHALGKYVVCYYSAGTYENWRSDASSFPAAVLGSSNGWPGEQWLDISQTAILEPIMVKRMQMCKSKGFDATDADNIDGYENSTGFPLTGAEQLTYDEYLPQQAHLLGLAAAQKNDPDQVAQMVNFFDFQVAEECYSYQECAQYSPYRQQGKLVVDIEYTNDGKASVSAATFASSVCPQDKGTLGFVPILTDLNLDAMPSFCP